MVCKEEVFMWFQNLKGSKRIEAMCGFFNMCYPLELRFYGTCLEDLGRRDFYTFRDEEIKANTLAEVLKIRNISDPCVRSKLIVVLSLLNSSNLHCAKELFKILSEEIKIESLASSGVFSDPKIVEQYLLLLTIAQHHPAFTFAQQTFLSELSISLESYAREVNPRIKYEYDETCLSGHVFPCVSVLSSPSASEREIFTNSFPSYRYATAFQRRSDMHQSPVRIRNLKVKPPHKKMTVRIRVLWGNNKNTDAFKTPHDLLVFHQKLVQQFPTEAKNSQEKCIPALPHAIATWGKQNVLNEGIISSVSEYIQQLNSRLPSYILESDFVTTFFMPSTHNRPTYSRSNRSIDCQHEMPPRNARLRSLTIYNSQISDGSPGHRPDTKPKNLPGIAKRQTENGSSVCGRASPQTSPLQSPSSSSPYASPVNSETSSRCASPWSHASVPCSDRIACNLHADSSPVEKSLSKDVLYDQWDSLRQYRIEELQATPNEELETLGILKDATLRKPLDRKSPPNGLLNNYIPKCVAVIKPGALTHAASNDSSPACSEYSSPPQSPSPAEVCNQSSSLSSSNEDNADKRTTSKPLAEVSKMNETESNVQDFKRSEDDILVKNLNRTSLSVLPFGAPYTTIVTQIPPPQNVKPAYLPIPCRTTSGPQHISPGTVVFDNQFSRVPLPSALTFLPGQPRAHTVTPDRVLSSANLPISTVSPFPVTSGSVTVPSASCSITTQKSSNATAVTNSGSSTSRPNHKRDGDMGAKAAQQPSETPYATGYILSSTTQLTAVSCSCFTTNSARPSPAPSPSMSPGTTPQPSAVPVSLPYIGMPYVFHSLPFLQAQAPANGFVPQPGMANPGQGYSYALANGITIPPELMYPGQTFTLQSPSTQGSPGQVASPSQCYGAFPQTTAVPLKLITCFNCGKVGHRGADCKEQSMDEINKTGRFQLNYNPVPKVIDSHE